VLDAGRGRIAAPVHKSFHVISLVLLISACGAGGGPTSAEYVDAAMAEAGDLTEFPNGRCVIAAVVDVVGADELAGAGIEPEEFASDGLGDPWGPGAALDVDRERLRRRLGECELAGEILDGLAPDLPDDLRACVVAVVDGEMAEAMTGLLLDGVAADELDDEATAALERCRDHS
jgi:hypothetical protein